jgi:uncharacterized metal-binding protein
MVKGAESAEHIIAIDGCPVGCARKALGHLKLNIDDYVVVTEKGIKKTHNLHPGKADVEKIVKSIRLNPAGGGRICSGEKDGEKSCSCV